MPIGMYFGFQRLISQPNRRTHLLYAQVGQELFLHQMPLILLILYNNHQLEKDYDKSTMDTVCVAVAIIHTLVITIEIGFYRYWLNQGVNLERRIKLHTRTRIGDNVRISLVGLIFGGVIMAIGIYAGTTQSCKSGFFTHEQFECRDCRDYNGESCVLCGGPQDCDLCEAEYFVEEVDLKAGQTVNADGSISEAVVTAAVVEGLSDLVEALVGVPTTAGVCLKCSFKFDGCVTCNEKSCVECTEGFFLDNGRCQPCAELEGCAEGQCKAGGCANCESGYYKEGKTCSLCKDKLKGCGECANAETCTQCTSDFLSITDDGTCKCNGNSPNMSVDRYGSCSCTEGFWLTEFGCQTCEQLIPGCTQCYKTSQNTGVALYDGANVGYRSSRTYYMDCRKCTYHNYRIRANRSRGTPPSCPACEDKWDGCGNCGTYGTRCSRCLPSHVFDTRNRSTPCKPCYFWMAGCTWCRSSTDCVAYD